MTEPNPGRRPSLPPKGFHVFHAGRTARRSAAALSMALLLSPAAVRASGLDAPMMGAGSSGPTAADPSAVFWNPAQLSRLDRAGAASRRPHLLLTGGAAVGRATYARERLGEYQTPDSLRFKAPIDSSSIDALKTGPSTSVGATPVSPLGDAFISIPVSERFDAGFGLSVPYAAALKFPDDGDQAWQLRQALIAATFATAAASFRVTDRFSLGAGVSYVGGLAELSKLQDLASLDEFHAAFANDPIGQANDFGARAPTQVRELAVLSRPISITRAVSHGATFNLGLSIQATDDLLLAAAYQHGTHMRYRGDFAIDMSDPFFTQDLASQGLHYKPLVTGKAELSFWLPRRASIGAGYRASSRLRLDGFVQLVTYSDVDAFVVDTQSPGLAQPKFGIPDRLHVTLPRAWKNVVWCEARGQLQATGPLSVFVGLGYQSPASPDTTVDVASVDGHRLIGTFGGSWRVSPKVTLAADARLQGILPRAVTRSDFDLGNGTYRLFIATIGGHLGVEL